VAAPREWSLLRATFRSGRDVVRRALVEAVHAECPAVTDAAQTHYAKTSDGAHIAYQVVGDGPLNLVFLSMGPSHVELAWELPSFARVFRRLASFSRLIRFDMRGTMLLGTSTCGAVAQERASCASSSTGAAKLPGLSWYCGPRSESRARLVHAQPSHQR